MGDKTSGLYEKFTVDRMDGKSAPGEKHFGCNYFVLDLDHDKYALTAILAYAVSCRGEYPKLASYLFRQALTSIDGGDATPQDKCDMLQGLGQKAKRGIKEAQEEMDDIRSLGDKMYNSHGFGVQEGIKETWQCVLEELREGGA